MLIGGRDAAGAPVDGRPRRLGRPDGDRRLTPAGVAAARGRAAARAARRRGRRERRATSSTSSVARAPTAPTDSVFRLELVRRRRRRATRRCRTTSRRDRGLGRRARRSAPARAAHGSGRRSRQRGADLRHRRPGRRRRATRSSNLWAVPDTTTGDLTGGWQHLDQTDLPAPIARRRSSRSASTAFIVGGETDPG